MSIRRNFILGDEWSYFKIYTGYKTADLILTEAVKPLLETLFYDKIIDKWFFIRYSDPDFHLRLRFKLYDTSLLGELVLRINRAIKPYIENRLVAKFQTDTYARELERYGENTIEYAETIFYYDSNMTIHFLDMIEGDEGERIRWLFAIKAVDELLNDFKYSENQKLELLNRLQFGFGSEFGMNKNLKIQIDRKFRNERISITNMLLESKDTNDLDFKTLFKLIHNRSLRNKKIVENITKMKYDNQLILEIDDLLSSYIHMMLNRIFKSKQRFNELIIYSLLYRFYKSEIARKKSRK